MNNATSKSGLLTIVLAIYCGSLLVAPAFAAFPNGVASGDTTQTTTVLWVRSTVMGELLVELALGPEFAAPVRRYRATVVDSQLPVKLELEELSPDTAYFYRCTDITGLSAAGRFRTAAKAGSFHGLHFGVSGDWRGELRPYSSIRNVKEKSLDFFIKLGDSIYADVPSPALDKAQAKTLADFRVKHAEVYSGKAGLNSLEDLQSSTSVWATIDDHEVTDNFIGYADVSTDARFSDDVQGLPINASTLYKNGLQAFLDYNPITAQVYDNTGSDPRTDGKVKLYRQQIYGDDAALMVLDSRSFRDTGLTGAIKPLSNNTLLGKRQLYELQNDLLDAEKQGITWKFIALPEPIQNLGSVGAEDRYEGYAGERAELLQFITGHAINNVVFITADIHGTLVNNLAYQSIAAKGLSQHATSAWEISTGAVAYFEPLGPTLVAMAKDFGLPGILSPQDFSQLSQPKQESYVFSLVNLLMKVSGYDSLGLTGPTIDAALLSGSYAATTTYGWTEFSLDPGTQVLVVTVWGIDAYPPPATLADLAQIGLQTPRIVSQFKVNPKRPSSVIARPAVLTAKLAASRKSAKIKQAIRYTANLTNSGKGVAKNAVLNFTILENFADVVGFGKGCHRFGNIVSCDLGDVSKQASRSLTLSPLKTGHLKLGVAVMTSSINDVVPNKVVIATPIAAKN